MKEEFILENWLSREFYRFVKAISDDNDTQSSKDKSHWRRAQSAVLVKLADDSGLGEHWRWIKTKRKKRT